MAKGGGSETTTVAFSPEDRAAIRNLRRQSGGIASVLSGIGREGQPGPGFLNAFRQIEGLGEGVGAVGDLGLGLAQRAGGLLSRGFQASDLDPFLNPFRSEVLGSINQSFDRARGLADRDVSQRFTATGAFGNDREGVLRGIERGEIERGRAEAVGQFGTQGFQTALGAALNQRNQLPGIFNLGAQLAMQPDQFGLAQGGLLGNLSLQGTGLEQQALRDFAQRQALAAGVLQGGLGPIATSETTEGSGGSFLGGLLGTALTIGGGLLGGPPGAMAASAVGGGLGGSVGGFEPPEFFGNPQIGQFA